MMWAATLLAIVVAALGFTIIEKKRAAGTLTYPLWRGNLLIPWAGFAVVFALLIGVQELPRAIALAEHGVPVLGVVVKQDEHCQTTYSYKVQGKEYTGLDSKCGLKAGNPHAIYYDPSAPENSTLYLPKDALKDVLIATGLIVLCLPTVLVVWLMLTNVIGRRKKT